MAKKVMLRNARLSFPSLWKTEEYNGTDTEKYAATFLIAKDDPQVKAIKAAMKEVAEEKFGTPLPKKLPLCLKDGDDSDYDGYEGHFSIKATTKRRPVVIDRQKTPVTEDDGVVYAGCYVNASVEIWAMDNSYGKKILCSLNGLQFVKDGEAFGAGGSNAMSDFDELDDADDTSGFDDAMPGDDEEDPFA